MLKNQKRMMESQKENLKENHAGGPKGSGIGFPPSTHKQENKTVSAKVDVPPVSSDYELFRSRRA